MDYLNQLTELQKTFGYVPGVISPVALLGLAGECGEVLDETVPSADLSKLDSIGTSIVEMKYTASIERIRYFVHAAREVDDMKKEIRRDEMSSDRLSYCAKDDEAFDEELCDIFYYLNALAIGRGLSINDLARMSHAKILRKQAVKTDNNQ